MKVFSIAVLICLVVCLFGTGLSKSANIRTKNQKFTTLKAGSSTHVKVKASAGGKKGGGLGQINTGDNNGDCKTQQVCETVNTPRGPQRSCKDVLVCPNS